MKHPIDVSAHPVLDKAYYKPHEIEAIKRGVLFIGTDEEWLRKCAQVRKVHEEAIARRAEERKDEIAEFHKITGGKYER